MATAPQAPSLTPSRKVVAAGTSGGAVAFVLWVLATYVFHADVPAPVEGIVELIVPGLAAGIAGWWVRDVEHKEIQE
jgi:hypothetical protein